VECRLERELRGGLHSRDGGHLELPSHASGRGIQTRHRRNYKRRKAFCVNPILAKSCLILQNSRQPSLPGRLELQSARQKV